MPFTHVNVAALVINDLLLPPLAYEFWHLTYRIYTGLRSDLHLNKPAISLVIELRRCNVTFLTSWTGLFVLCFKCSRVHQSTEELAPSWMLELFGEVGRDVMNTFHRISFSINDAV